MYKRNFIYKRNLLERQLAFRWSVLKWLGILVIFFGLIQLALSPELTPNQRKFVSAIRTNIQ